MVKFLKFVRKGHKVRERGGKREREGVEANGRLCGVRDWVGVGGCLFFLIFCFLNFISKDNNWLSYLAVKKSFPCFGK